MIHNESEGDDEEVEVDLLNRFVRRRREEYEKNPESIHIDAQNKDMFNVTLFNLNSLYLLFKTDVTSSFSILNNFKTTRFNNKPAGISIKHK